LLLLPAPPPLLALLDHDRQKEVFRSCGYDRRISTTPALHFRPRNRTSRYSSKKRRNRARKKFSFATEGA
jgi:hypothetical protein